MPVLNRIADYSAEMTGWRRYLHQHPELEFNCHATAGFIAGWIMIKLIGAAPEWVLAGYAIAQFAAVALVLPYLTFSFRFRPLDRDILKAALHYGIPLIIGGALSWVGLAKSALEPALALVAIVPFLPGPDHDPKALAERAPVRSPLESFEAQLKLPVDLGLFFFAFANAGVPSKSRMRF